jgi:hypothetical protein
MLVIPLQPVPSQVVGTQLSGQDCQISVYQKAFGLFLDLSVGGSLIVAGTICENLNRIVRSVYLGFGGDLAFVDTQGDSDPTFDGLGVRYFLVYLSATELPSG